MSLTVWRISHKRYTNIALISGGYNRGRGRWNSKGTSLIYTSATLSLAALETLVSMEIENFSNIFVSISLKIPDNFPIQQVNESLLPHNWRDNPSPKVLASIGDQWFTSKTTVLLRVPSAIIPQEYNYLINPLHPDFEKILIDPPQSFILDRSIKSIDKNLLTKL
ncbi:MAG: RES family NAD+ phosphorylase [Trichodesmium sp. MAG_R04]|nr:RES family NAD+ phosphorylase [Trichodesmium sp. MAG_R04]